MTEKSYATSSQYPPLAPGKLRIYSMRFCPYAQRTRLVLHHKNIDHETVNIHLKQKPSWFLERNPFGLVPVLEQDDKVIYESLFCSDYLDEVYPENKLTPSDPYKKAQDRIAVELFSKAVTAMYKAYRATEDQAAVVEEFLKALDRVEKILADKGTPFFGGDKVQMVDFNIWPHAERFGPGQELFPALKVSAERFPKFREWMKTMETVPAVQKTMFDNESHIRFIKSYMSGNPDYDFGL